MWGQNSLLKNWNSEVSMCDDDENIILDDDEVLTEDDYSDY